MAGITIEEIPGIPRIMSGDNIGEIILNSVQRSDTKLKDQDIICVASKAVSIAEHRDIKLSDIKASKAAEAIHNKVPRKDPRIIQLMIDQTGQQDGSRLIVQDNYIAGWLPNGLRLTSAGVDKLDSESAILLPNDPDQSARLIGQQIFESTGLNIGIIITDSDGREDKKGATQLAIGVYGVPPLRITESIKEDGTKQIIDETLCDMLAASAALIMGQRNKNRPAVLISGIDYSFDIDASIKDALH